MHATLAAVEEGILPGGGVAMLRAGKAFKKVRTHNDDQRTGVDIVRKALSWPARQIAINTGEDGSIIASKILEKDQYAFASSLKRRIREPRDQGHRPRPISGAGLTTSFESLIGLRSPVRPT